MSPVVDQRDGRATTRPPPTVRYGLAWEPEPEVSGPAGFPTKVEEDTSPLTWFVLVVCLSLWAVIGLFFWLPILVREIVWFSVALGRSMLHGTRPTAAGKALREAVSFYFRGFRVAMRAILGTPSSHEEEGESETKGGRIALELLWAGLVWYVVLFAAGAIQATPVDAVYGVASLPWSEWFDTVVGWFPVVDTSPAVDPSPVVDPSAAGGTAG